MSTEYSYFGSERLNDKRVFWMGGNGCEYIAWEGSHQIFIYPTWEHPNPPEGVIQHDKRIDSLKEFDAALKTGKAKKLVYVDEAYHPDYSKM